MRYMWLLLAIFHAFLYSSLYSRPNEEVSGKYISLGKSSFDMSVFSSSNPDTIFQPIQMGEYKAIVENRDRDYLIFVPDTARVYFPRIVLACEADSVVIQTQDNDTTDYILNIYNYSGRKFSYYVDNARISQRVRLSDSREKLELKLKTIPKSLLLASITKGCKAIISPVTTDSIYKMSNVYIYRCTPNDSEANKNGDDGPDWIDTLMQISKIEIDRKMPLALLLNISEIKKIGVDSVNDRKYDPTIPYLQHKQTIKLSIETSYQYYPRNTLQDSLDSFYEVSLFLYNNRRFAFLMSIHFNSYLRSPHFQTSLVWSINEFISTDYSFYYSSNEQWREYYNMATASIALNARQPIYQNIPFIQLYVEWRPRLDFGNFKKYSHDHEIENIRFNPSLLLKGHIAYTENDIFFVSGIVREAFYTSLIFSFYHRINIRYTFKGKSFDPPPQTPLETEGFHQIGIGYRF